jgi:hypothetical protein
MISLNAAVRQILVEPTPDALVELQGAIFASGRAGEPVERALQVAGQFHAYLCELQAKLSAKDYAELASRLDIGAVGAVALESLLSSKSESFWQSLVLGGVAEGLMIGASRQYIKAWEAETGMVHTLAAWNLADALWHASSTMQPGLERERRWQAIEGLLAPAHDPQVSAPTKALLLGRIYQVVLLTHLARLLPEPAQDSR